MQELYDRILNLINTADLALDWNFKGWSFTGATLPYSQKDWNQTLVTRMNQVSATIRTNLNPVGGLDCLIVGTRAADIIEDLEYFVEEYTPQVDGMKQIGVVAGRYKIFMHSFINPNVILCGRGADIFDYQKDTSVGVINIIDKLIENVEEQK